MIPFMITSVRGSGNRFYCEAFVSYDAVSWMKEEAYAAIVDRDPVTEFFITVPGDRRIGRKVIWQSPDIPTVNELTERG